MLAALAPGARVAAIPTGVDPAYYAPNGGQEAPAQLVFTGSMDWYANEDGIVHFLDAILPAIRGEIPETGLTIVGRNPTPRLRQAAARAGASVTGTVDDVRPFISEAAVYIVPLRIGGGTRLKIFEALAMGKAVVSTPVGAEGLPLEPGVHYLGAGEHMMFHGPIANTIVSLSVATGATTKIKLMSTVVLLPLWPAEVLACFTAPPPPPKLPAGLLAPLPLPKPCEPPLKKDAE